MSRRTAFLATYGVMAVGWSIALLDATAITTKAGHGSNNGAVYTSLYLAVYLLASAIAVPYSPALAARFGGRRILTFAVAVPALSFLTTGVLILSGVKPIPVLMANAVVFGIFYGIFTSLSPLFSKAYLSGDDMAGAFARFSVAGAVGLAIGGVAGGAILNQVQPGWGLVMRAFLALPFAIFLALRPPPVEPEAPVPASGPWRTMLLAVRGNDALRRAALLGGAVSMFAAPLASLIVPVADALRQTPLLPGAGILMAGLYAGQIITPAIVSRLSNGRSQMNAAAIAAIATGSLLAVYGVASLIFQDEPELIVWAVVGLAFGAFWLAQRSVNLGAATDAGDESNAGEAVAVFMFAVSIAAPIGVLIWGFLINHVSVEAAIFAGAAGTVAVGAAYLSRPKA